MNTNSNEFLLDDYYKAVKIKSIKKSENLHTYDFQVDMDHSFLLENNIISSNCMEYVPSISLRVTKGKIKPDDLSELEYLYADGIPKHLAALGIVSKIELYKSRFTRPFRKVQLMIPYDFGLPEYAGLFDYLKENGLITDGTRKGYYNFKDLPQEKDFTRKQFIRDGFADLIMDYILKCEKNGKVFDFIMKASDDDHVEDVDDELMTDVSISEEINDSVKG